MSFNTTCMQLRPKGVHQAHTGIACKGPFMLQPAHLVAPCSSAARPWTPSRAIVTVSCSQQHAARSPAAQAALFTGTYAMMAGIALIVAPVKVFGLILNPAEVTEGWIRFGGIMFTLVGIQYFGTGWHDSKIASNTTAGKHLRASNNSSNRNGGDDVQTEAQPYARSFYMSTVWSRLFFSAGCVALVMSQQSPVGLLVLAALNALGSISMLLAVKKTDAILAGTATAAAGLDANALEGSNPLGVTG